MTVEFAGDTSVGGDLRLFTDRNIHGDRWRFILTVPYVFWTDLLNWNWPDMPQRDARDAYDHAQEFWDYLVEWNADEFANDAKPDAVLRTRHRKLKNFDWLKAEYHKFKAEHTKASEQAERGG